MKAKIKSLLKRWPALYHFIGKGYTYSTLRFRYLEEYLLGTRVREGEWATRHLRNGNDWNNMRHLGEDDEWVISYWDSRDHSHRPFLIEKISTLSPISSILEIGCNCGPNLYLLAKKFPNAEIRGIDINPKAVQKGNEWLAQEGILNVKLTLGKADELGQFQNKNFDVVFTDAVLIYIGRDKIREIIKEMVRVAHKGLFLMEWHCFEPKKQDPYGLGVRHHSLWKRDYIALLEQFVPVEQIHVTKLTEDIWPDKNWKELGAVIEVVM